jgi:hypothetical protein
MLEPVSLYKDESGRRRMKDESGRRRMKDESGKRKRTTEKNGDEDPPFSGFQFSSLLFLVPISAFRFQFSSLLNVRLALIFLTMVTKIAIIASASAFRGCKVSPGQNPVLSLNPLSSFRFQLSSLPHKTISF